MKVEFWHGEYIGSHKELVGKSAIVKVETHYVQDMTHRHGDILDVSCTAQFDDTSTGVGFGWHPFSVAEFSKLNLEDE